MKYGSLILAVGYLFIPHKIIAQTETLEAANIQFELPNNKWSLEDKQEANGFTVYFYKREPIMNKSGKKIIPTISFVIETIPDSTDIIQYSIAKRTKKPFNVTEVFSHDSKNAKIKFGNAIGYKGTYHDDDIEHTIYIVHLINMNKGVQVICDITSELFPQYEQEFLKMLISIKKN